MNKIKEKRGGVRKSGILNITKFLKRTFTRDKKIIFVLLTSGMGVRLMSIARYLALAKQKNIIPFFLWPQSSDVSEVSNIDRLLSNKFHCIGIEACEFINFNLPSHIESSLDKFISSDFENINFDKFDKNKYTESDKNNTRDWRNFLKNEELFANGELMRKEIKKLKPAKSIDKKIKEFKQKNFIGKILGVHIRAGDIREHNIKVNKEIIKRRKKRYIEIKSYIQEIKKIENNYDKIFVSCEDKYHLRKLKKIFKGKLIYYPKEHGKINEKHAQEALIEIFLLSSCDFLLKPKSTFSKASQLIGDVPAAVLDEEYINSVSNINFLTNNSSKEELARYWKGNKHVYVCSTKVGSTVIRKFSKSRKIDIPYINTLFDKLQFLPKSKKQILPNAPKNIITDIKDRKAFFLARCPFHRVVSSYEFMKSPRFTAGNKRYERKSMHSACKRKYMRKGIDLDKMDIVEYINFMIKEIEKGEWNILIRHFYPQREFFDYNYYQGFKVSLVWQTEKIEDLLRSWNRIFDWGLNAKTRKNVNIKNENKYIDYYIRYPELFDLVKDAFKIDLDWLNPSFDYESKFRDLLRARRKSLLGRLSNLFNFKDY